MNSTATGRSVTCSGGPVAEHGDLRPEWDERKRGDRRNRRDGRRQQENRLFDAERGDRLLERQLDAVGQALQIAARADPVGSPSQLHPAQDLAFGEDRDQHRQHQEDKDEERLGEDQPPGVVPEAGNHLAHPIFDRRHRLSTPSCRCTAEPGEFSGSHTTWSGISVMASGKRDRAARGADRDLVAVGGADLVGGRGRQPHHRGARGAGQVRLAVLQPPVVEQHPPPRQHGFTGARLRRLGSGDVGAAPCVPSQVPSCVSSARAACTVGRPRSIPISSARVSSTRRSGVGVWRAAQPRSCGVGLPS